MPATLLVNKSGSHRAVLPFLLSLVDGGNGAAHGLQISETLKIGQMPRRVGVKNAGQGVVVGQHGLHIVDAIDQVHGPVQVEEHIVDNVSLHAPTRMQFRDAGNYRRDQRLGKLVKVTSQALLYLRSS